MNQNNSNQIPKTEGNNISKSRQQEWEERSKNKPCPKCGQKLGYQSYPEYDGCTMCGYLNHKKSVD